MQAIPAKGTNLAGHWLAGYGMEKRDVSSVSIKQLREILNDCGATDRQRLANESGIYVRSIHRIFRDGEQTSIGVTMADRVLMAVAHLGLGDFRLGVDLEVYPTLTRTDALVMAVQENLDDDERLTADQAQIEVRIEELLALRAFVLS